MDLDQPSSPATLADVARRAGVSLATASRALNGSAGRQVGALLLDRVRQAATELDYSPNAQAQAMARGTTATLGLVVHDVHDPDVPWTEAQVIAERWRDSRLIATEGLGHRAILRDPGVIGSVVDFLRE